MELHVDDSGFVVLDEYRWPCALGREGIGPKTTEGDGLTPLGSHQLGRVFWRKDRLSSIQTTLPCLPITKSMGWCDDPDQDAYNTLIELPHAGSFEELWREDHVYDVIVELLYNTKPIINGQGSAIFMHIARPDYRPTEGCIALKQSDLLSLLQMVNKGSRLIVRQK